MTASDAKSSKACSRVVVVIGVRRNRMRVSIATPFQNED
jgi:hypothetical protein